MDLSLFIITIIVASYAYYHQFYKIIKRKSSVGISIQAYIISSVAEIIMLFASDVFLVKIIVIFHLIFSILGIYLIYIYRENLEKFSIDFFISLFFSFFMIFGVSQSLSSYKNKSVKTNVSINSYVMFSILNFIMIYLEKDILVIVSLFITNILYFFIIFNTMFKNSLNKNISLY